jgi:hypothetical protein
MSEVERGIPAYRTEPKLLPGNIWYVVSGGWLIGLGGDRLWRDFVAPFLGLHIA